MTSLQSDPDNASGEMPSLVVDAAMQYADNGIPVVLFDVRPGNHKQCGNLVGDASDDNDKWHEHVSSDKAVIRCWLDQFGARATGLATSPGAADCVVLDVDKPDEIPVDWWQRLDTAVFQSTRTDDDRRGHYWFDLPPGERFENFSFPWGEVRCDGGGLILWPTRHAKTAAGGRYKWIRQGDTQPLPDAVATMLRTKGQRQGGVVPVTAADVKAFCAAHVGNEHPPALANLTRRLAAEQTDTRSLLRMYLRIAAQEARVSMYPYQTAIDELRKAAARSYALRGRTLDEVDFTGLVRNGIAQARLKTIEQCEAEANRQYGSAHNSEENTGSLDAVNADLARDESADAGQPDQSADPSGNAVDSDDATTDDEAESFWSSSPQLSDLRQFAHARMVGQWAMLGNALARIIAHIPPHVVLPPTVGDYASLNLFVAVVGRSGDSKSASMAAASSWLRTEPDYPPSKPGSGEGLAKCFAYVRTLPQNQGGGREQTGKQWSVLAKIPEVDTLTATAARGGATIMSTLREGWSGERLGTDYASDEKRIVLEANRYRLCLVIGVQPGRAGALFDDAEGGTPQRILWLPSADPDMPETEPDEPPALDLGRWESQTPVIDIDISRNRLLADRADPTKFDVLAIPDVAREQVKATRRAVARGDAGVDPLDGHKLLVRLKVAAALMVLERRRQTITESDWERAGIVMAVSDRTRAHVLNQLQRNRAEANRSRGTDEAVREMAKTKVISAERQRITGMAARIVDKLGENDGQSLAVLRRNLSAKTNRDVFDDAVTYAVESALLRREDFIARNGQEGTRLWLASANGSGVS